MDEPIPWNAPAVVALKRRGDAAYVPEVAGLTLNAALAYASDPELPATTRVRIPVNWGGKEVRLEGRHIWQLVTASERPPLSE
jgi:hypothetical protein